MSHETGSVRLGHTFGVIQRYQDVALEILQRLFSKTFHEVRAIKDYFSDKLPEYRQKIIGEIKAYWKKTEGDKAEK